MIGSRTAGVTPISIGAVIFVFIAATMMHIANEQRRRVIRMNLERAETVDTRNPGDYTADQIMQFLPPNMEQSLAAPRATLLGIEVKPNALMPRGRVHFERRAMSGMGNPMPAGSGDICAIVIHPDDWPMICEHIESMTGIKTE